MYMKIMQKMKLLVGLQYALTDSGKEFSSLRDASSLLVNTPYTKGSRTLKGAKA